MSGTITDLLQRSGFWFMHPSLAVARPAGNGCAKKARAGTPQKGSGPGSET